MVWKYLWVYKHITDEVIVTYDKNQDILTHPNQKRDLWTIYIPIYISPSLVKETGSVKTKYYKYFVPKQFTRQFTLIRIQIIGIKNL